MEMPAGAVVHYVLAKWASAGSGGLLKLGPTMAHRLWAAVEEAEETDSDDALEVRATAPDDPVAPAPTRRRGERLGVLTPTLTARPACALRSVRGTWWNERDGAAPSVDELQKSIGVEMLLDGVGEAVEHVSPKGAKARRVRGRVPPDPRLAGHLRQPRASEGVILEQSMAGRTPGRAHLEAVEKPLHRSAPRIVRFEGYPTVVD